MQHLHLNRLIIDDYLTHFKEFELFEASIEKNSNEFKPVYHGKRWNNNKKNKNKE
jgi:hypothetical protein